MNLECSFLLLKMLARGKLPWSLTKQSSWFTSWECRGLKEPFIVTLVLSLHAVKEWTSRGKLQEMHHSPMPNSRTSEDFLSVGCLSSSSLWHVGVVTGSVGVWAAKKRCESMWANASVRQRRPSKMMHFHNEGHWGHHGSNSLTIILRLLVPSVQGAPHSFMVISEPTRTTI